MSTILRTPCAQDEITLVRDGFATRARALAGLIQTGITNYLLELSSRVRPFGASVDPDCFLSWMLFTQQMVQDTEALSSAGLLAYSPLPELQTLVNSLEEMRVTTERLQGLLAHLPQQPDRVQVEPCSQHVTLNQETPLTRKDWEVVAIAILHDNRSTVKSLADVLDRLNARGYPHKRQTLYKMRLLLSTAKAEGIYSPRKRTGRVASGFRTANGIEAVDDRATG